VGDAQVPVAERAAGMLPAIGLVIAGACSTQFGGALGNTLFPLVGPAGATALRLGFAAVVLLALTRPRLRRRSRQDWLTVVAFGLTLAAMNSTFYQSISRLPLGTAVTLEFVGPLAVAIFGTRQRLNVLWAALALVAVVLLGSGTLSTRSRVGLALALAAGVCWAAYILLSARTGRRFTGTDGLALAMGLAAAVVAPFGLVGGGARLWRATPLLKGAAVGMLSSVIPYTAELWALRRIPPSLFGILMSFEPAIACLAGWAVLGESLGPRQLVAMALVVVASVGATRTARRAVPVDS
jgi:inner membrane transporter RhtA